MREGGAPHLRSKAARCRSGAGGFTLVELLVALVVLATMALMSWRGLSGMMNAQTLTSERSDQVVTMQAVMGQWRADLDALVSVGRTRAADWDGQVLRLTRSHPSDPAQGVLVVGWTTRVDREGRTQWLRWQSAPVRDRAAFAAAWAAAAVWARTPSADDRSREVSLGEVRGWQVFFYRQNAWSSPFSSADPQQTAAMLQDSAVPDGVRLILTLPDAHALGGKLTLDWVRPTRSGGHGG